MLQLHENFQERLYYYIRGLKVFEHLPNNIYYLLVLFL